MYIKTERENLQAISLPKMDGIAEFSENNVAQVTEDDGTVLIDEIDHISEHNS